MNKSVEILKRHFLESFTVLILFIAVFSLPLGYYTFLRFAVSICSIYLAYQFYANKVNNYMWGSIFILILFNPIVPIYLSKDIWIVIDIVVAIIGTTEQS